MRLGLGGADVTFGYMSFNNTVSQFYFVACAENMFHYKNIIISAVKSVVERNEQ